MHKQCVFIELNYFVSIARLPPVTVENNLFLNIARKGGKKTCSKLFFILFRYKIKRFKFFNDR